MRYDDRRNKEGYSDPTAFATLSKAAKEERAEKVAQAKKADSLARQREQEVRQLKAVFVGYL